MDQRSSRARRALGFIAAALAIIACDDARPAVGDVADGGPSTDAAMGSEDAATPEEAPGLAVYPVRPVAIVDTRAEAAPCGAHAALDATHSRIDVSLDACAGLELPPGAAAIAATLTLVPREPGATIEVRAGAPQSISSQPVMRAGPHDAWTSGLLTMLGASRTLRIESSNGAAADVIVELTAVLAPPGPGARGVRFLERPVRLYTARWDEAGVWHGPTSADVDERLALNEIAEEPLGALPGDVVGLIGVAHVGPDGLCDEGAFVSLGPARAEGDTRGLARIATCAPESTFPSRASTAFVIGASASQQLVLRAERADALVYLDVAAYLVPYREGDALYHPLASRIGAEIELGVAPRQVASSLAAGAIAASGRISAWSAGRGSLAAGAEPTTDAPSGPHTTLELRDGTSTTAFTTRLDANGAFVLEADVEARLALAVDAYWAP
ncbi:hypothetical protein [Sandaracinus amylolyticus]|uniref:Uncharacterized protein n=1 Tax=Sandaracinus amylolyticus TaxID=927083 RepID=A0A0F6W4K7_9BACT|nr:hypothetical protein [Sandaracinus amylolyticus]AKF07280.1 hypothetical protein DB32_004429 [Sandaracinus amylolyticus]